VHNECQTIRDSVNDSGVSMLQSITQPMEVGMLSKIHFGGTGV
jgi:hypothetical protein